MFAAAIRVPALMEQLESTVLSRYSPCTIADQAELSRAIGETHAELILVHPFREGNGRVARHFSNLMVWQAGRLPIDFRRIAGDLKLAYFAAIRAALGLDYGPIQKLFETLIAASGSSDRAQRR